MNTVAGVIAELLAGGLSRVTDYSNNKLPNPAIDNLLTGSAIISDAPYSENARAAKNR